MKPARNYEELRARGRRRRAMVDEVGQRAVYAEDYESSTGRRPDQRARSIHGRARAALVLRRRSA